MNRQASDVDIASARPGRQEQQRRSVRDIGRLPRPSNEDNANAVIYNVFSPLNSSSEESSSADQQRCVPATSRSQEDATCLREPSFSLIGSPSSVAELQVFEALSTAHVSQPILFKDQGGTKKKNEEFLHPLKRRATRGVDSPKKIVDTRNVYMSAVRASSAPEPIVPTVSNTSSFNSKQSSLTSASFSSSTDSRAGPITRRPPLDDLLNQLLHHRISSHILSKNPDPRACIGRPSKKNGLHHHRRQNTSDSTRSAVAAVARGASKAVAEDDEITWGRTASISCKTTALDRPVARPRRQHTAGSADFPSNLTENDVIDNANPKSTPSARTKVLSTKAPARIARPKPPRHDCTSQLAGGGCAKIKLMKRLSLQKAAENGSGDKQVVCPLRQSTTERASSAPVLEIAVSPKALFDDSMVTSDLDDSALPRSPESVVDNAGDDDSLALEDVQPSPHKGHFNHVAASDSTILAWLNMPQHRWSNSEPVLKVPSPAQLKRSYCRSLSKSESNLIVHELETEQVVAPGLGRQPSYDESTSCNDPSCDDRMFQAWMKMPPRACTTHATIDNDLKTGRGVDCTPTGKVIDIAEQWVAAAASGSAARRRANNISDIKDVSGIAADASVDNVSLPSIFMDCTGLPTAADDSFGPRLMIETSRTPLTMTPTSIETPDPRPTTVHDCYGTNNIIDTKTPIIMAPHAVPTVTDASVSIDLKRRTSLPPLKPHRRKPSLFMDDSIELESDQKTTMWSSLPVLSHATLPSPIPVTCDTLPKETVSGLRSLWPPLHSEGSIPASTAQPKRKGIVNAHAPEQPVKSSASKRASLPPIMPHRRKPSLFLDDLASDDSGIIERVDDAYNGGRIESMWSSLPIFSKKDLPLHDGRVSQHGHPFGATSQVPPTMPHRRKPSLHIIEQEGPGGTIEAMLKPGYHGSENTTTRSTMGASTTRKLLPSRSESFCSIVLMEGEVEI